MTSSQETLQQIEGGRASFAFQQTKSAVNELKKLDDIKLYSSYLKRLPSMIQVNGLGQAMAFYYSKQKKDGKGKPYMLIYRTIHEWLLKKHPEIIRNELIESVVDLSSESYRMVTTETMALLGWMQRFATGMSNEAMERDDLDKAEGQNYVQN
ncbi:type III-B CRISPR module-associated protein Cmr5 [Paenibacillus sp. SYP-B4298]|uniref:type III-B CRISPR module-associated protein Cmr5 n=1 Tax=Paenibacillus sp. SYP-B4298 TaxID=2996034 RepID=UPI0022DD69AA|nr:type III-B CRISPR module-associated protein Cmr5 [Paenibacillus sp. SYP-B4298]